MNFLIYKRYLTQFVREAIQNSDGSNAGISGYLWAKRISGIFVQHRTEKERALHDARKAFDEHRHWPREIIISHLGISDRDEA